MNSLSALKSLNLCLALTAAVAFAQGPIPAQPAAVASPVPADPDQFMRQAADAMSLTAPDMKPWHLRAKYRTLYPDGVLDREGVLEEWWAGADQYKFSDTAGDTTRVDYRTKNGKFFTGDEHSKHVCGLYILTLLLHPLPPQSEMDMFTFTRKDVKLGEHDFVCYASTAKDTKHPWLRTQSYCFDPGLPVARLSLDSLGTRTTWNSIVRIDSHYLAKKVTVSTQAQDPKTVLEIEQIDPDTKFDEAVFTPPADAKPALGEVAVSSGVMAGLKISGAAPQYPLAAKTMRQAGTVTLLAVITKDGSVEHVTVVSGPSLLQQAAIDAVKTWRYRPYLLNGEPAEVETTVHIVF